MKKLFPHFWSKFLALTVLVLCATAAQAADKKPVTPSKAKAAAKAPVAAPEAPAVEYKSIFEEPKVDPFFPMTTRLGFGKQQQQTPDAKPYVPVEQIFVKGIFLGKEKTVFINGKTLAEGESAVLKLPKGAVTIHVTEIRERSVMVRIDPDPVPKEIFLRATP